MRWARDSHISSWSSLTIYHGIADIKIKLTVLLVSTFFLSGCQTPFLVFPGKALQGELGSTESFSFAEQFTLLQLETLVDEPYSVFLRSTVIDGELYIDAAPARRWGKHLAQFNQVRIKLGDKIYPAIAREVTDPELTAKFLPGRKLYRLDPVTD